jgi:hypothetical protein
MRFFLTMIAATITPKEFLNCVFNKLKERSSSSRERQTLSAE